MAHENLSSTLVPDPLPRISTAEVIDRLAAAKERTPKGARPVMAFDADGTIWKGDAGVDMFEALLADNAIRPPAAAALARLAAKHGFEAGSDPVALARAIYLAWEKQLTPRCPEDETFAMMAWIFAGFTEAELTAYARDVLTRAKIAERIRPEVRALVAWARSNDVEVLVTSASPRTPVVVGVADIPIPPESVFALTTRVEGGVHQAELTGVFVYADGKATAVSQGRPGAFLLGGFGDSAYDGALMRMSQVPVAIGPGPSLLRAASSIPGLIELATT